MARIRNEQHYNDARTKLLVVGLNLIRTHSYVGVGINDLLREADIPKGSFYHYFSSKEDFGVEVSRYYNEQQLASAEHILKDTGCSPADRLKIFFETAYDEFEALDFTRGCLMCNLSTELADEEPAFQEALQSHWQALSSVIADCIAETDKADLGLAHLSDAEAADWLLNSWSGALTRMKAVRNGTPLKLFLKTTFKESD